MKFLVGLLAFISSLYTVDSQSNSSRVLAPLNSAIISYSDTYFAPAVAEPGNFPKAKTVILITQSEELIIKTVPKTVVPPTPAPIVVLPPSPAPAPVTPPPKPIDNGDPYTAQNSIYIDQATQWLKMDFSLNGSIYDGERSLSNLSIDREYWKVDVFAYWAPGIPPPRPLLEKDYFKLEIYDEETKKLIYTITSGNDENIHKSQIFKKAGKYGFKASSKTNGQYEVTFLISPTMAK